VVGVLEKKKKKKKKKERKKEYNSRLPKIIFISSIPNYSNVND
jgi:hypothetical protein